MRILQNREDGRNARAAGRILIRRHKLTSQLGCAESVKQTRAGEGPVQRDAYAAPYALGELVGTMSAFLISGAFASKYFCWEFSGVGSRGRGGC